MVVRGRRRRRDEGKLGIICSSSIVGQNLWKLWVLEIKHIALRAICIGWWLPWVGHIHVRGSLRL